uniref:Uncharacterized protein n=1 Tax=Ciona intestinalis TaxID=7719 RepID=H2XK91_CIOIN
PHPTIYKTHVFYTSFDTFFALLKLYFLKQLRIFWCNTKSYRTNFKRRIYYVSAVLHYRVTDHLENASYIRSYNCMVL